MDKRKLADAILRAPKVGAADQNPDQPTEEEPANVGLQDAMRKMAAAFAKEDMAKAAQAFRDAFNICDGYGSDDKKE